MANTTWDWSKVDQELIERLRRAVADCSIGFTVTLRPIPGRYGKGECVPLRVYIVFDEDAPPTSPAWMARLAERKGLLSRVYEHEYKTVILSKRIPFEDALERVCEIIEEFSREHPREILEVPKYVEALEI